MIERRENIYQERDAFDDFAAHVDQSFERRKPTPEEVRQMDSNLLQLGRIFEGSDVRWHLDGAQNISLLKGEYIGIHKDIDISVEEADMAKFYDALAKSGYGLFLSYPKNPKEPRGKYVMERVEDLKPTENRPDGLMIAAIDEKGKIREEGLNYPDVHLVKRNEQGKPIGWGGIELPEKWFEAHTVELHGVQINLSHPAKVAYFKLHSTRNYDFTDLRALAETGELTPDDVAEIEQTIKAENLVRRVATNIRTGRQAKIRELDKWVAEAESKFDREKSPIRTAYHLLDARSPLELSNLYTAEDQKLMASHEWDYRNSELIVNKVKEILETTDPNMLKPNEQECRREILWFWYHHAISCAIWRYKDKSAAQSYASKALEYQSENHPNKITQLFDFLVNDKFDEAERWASSISEEPEKTTGAGLVDAYKKGNFFR